MKKKLIHIGSKLKHPAIRDAAGIGYVIIPKNLNLEEYLKICLRNSTVTIITNSGEILKNIYVDRGVWNEIEFPKDNKTKGSAVIWLNIPSNDSAVVIGALNKKDQLNKNDSTNIFNFERSDINQTSAQIRGDGNLGKIDIIVDGKIEDESQINIKVLNDDENGKLSIYVQGDIIIESENDINLKCFNIFNLNIVDEVNPENQTNISYELTKGFVYYDEFKNNIQINDKGIVIIDKYENKISTSENGIEAFVDKNKISLKKDVAGILFKGNYIKIDENGITIDSPNSDIQINSGDNVIQMNDAGINIDSADQKVYINGSKDVLYSKIPGLKAISDVSQIGVSSKVKVG